MQALGQARASLPLMFYTIGGRALMNLGAVREVGIWPAPRAVGD